MQYVTSSEKIGKLDWPDEQIEIFWLYAVIDGGEAGAAFLGSQGEEEQPSPLTTHPLYTIYTFYTAKRYTRPKLLTSHHKKNKMW